MRLAERVAQLEESVPAAVWNAVRQALLSGETHYTPRPGLRELRRKLAEVIARRGGPSYDLAVS